MKTVSEFKNDLLKRKEIVANLESHENPGFDNSQKKVAQHFKTTEELVVIKRVSGNFGSHEFTIEAFIYDSAKNKEEIEPKKKEKKKK